MRQGHKGHPICEYGSKAACDRAARIAMGQCSSMLGEDRQCPHWGLDKVDDRPYCGQHLTAVYLAADKRRREVAIREAQDARIDRFIAWRKDHASVWDLPPADWSPA